MCIGGSVQLLSVGFKFADVNYKNLLCSMTKPKGTSEI